LIKLLEGYSDFRRRSKRTPVALSRSWPKTLNASIESTPACHKALSLYPLVGNRRTMFW